jgi:hypothetical protein
MGMLLVTGKRRRGGQADNFVAVQRFEKGLNAAADEAPHPAAVDVHITHARRSCYLSGWWAANEGDLYSSGRKLLVHTGQRGSAAGSETSTGLLIRCVVPDDEDAGVTRLPDGQA